MFTQFQAHYPKGSLLTELSAIDHGKYIVRCLVQVEGTTLVTALAAAQTVELAEEQARNRALAVLGISTTTVTGEKETPLATREVPAPLNPTATAPVAFSDTSGIPPATLSESLGRTPPSVFPETVKASEATRSSFSELRYEDTAARATPAQLVADEIPFTEEFSSNEVETLQEDVETPLWMAEKMPQAQLDDAPAMPSSESELETHTSSTPATSAPIDFSDIIARTNVELKRLGWTNQQGRDYLVQTYGKRSRQLLTDGELLDFLHHLESEPSPD
jgi:hypothetical protein